CYSCLVILCVITSYVVCQITLVYRCCVVILFSFLLFVFLFFFNDTATTEIYTLSLHDALPILPPAMRSIALPNPEPSSTCSSGRDRKSTRLNSSHDQISYAVFCLKKKKKKKHKSENRLII